MSLPLLHDPADIVRWLMVQSKQAADPTVQPLGSYPAYVDVEPDSPDSVITVQGTTGQSDGRDMVSGELNQHYGFQVRVRSVGKVEGFVKAQSLRTWLSESIYAAVITITPFGPASYAIQCFSKIGTVLSIGLDEPNTKRWVHTLNAYVTIRRTS